MQAHQPTTAPTHDLATGGGTLAELVAAINASTKDTGVTATAVKVADGSYRLLAQSTSDRRRLRRSR